MVVTHAQASISYAGGHPQHTEQQKANLPAPPSPSTLATPPDQLATLTQQVQALVVAVQELQEQHSVTTQRQPRPPTSPMAAAPASQQSTHGRSPQREAHCHHASPRNRHREALKRPWSPFRIRVVPLLGGGTGRSLNGGTANSTTPLLTHLLSLRGGRGESTGEYANHKAERRLDEYHQRLEELSRRLNN